MAAENKLEKSKQTNVKRRQEQSRYYQPAVDIKETSDEVVLKFDMPGVGRDNVELTVDRSTLTVTGEVDKEESGTAVYRETRVGDYRRQFALSEDVDPNNITAEMKAGVLTVKIHKPETARPKKIEITSGE